jgi:hypothetical protein
VFRGAEAYPRWSSRKNLLALRLHGRSDGCPAVLRPRDYHALRPSEPSDTKHWDKHN